MVFSRYSGFLCHYIAEILKVVLNSIILTLILQMNREEKIIKSLKYSYRTKSRIVFKKMLAQQN
jgi:hypothetical protein